MADKLASGNPMRTLDRGNCRNVGRGFLQGRRAVCLVGMSFVMLIAAAADASELAVVAHGRSGPDMWRVTVGSDGSRRGVCLEAAIYRRDRSGGSASGKCSAPAARRGIVRSVVRRKQSGRPRLTVLGGAFSSRVEHVFAIGIHGAKEDIPFRLRRSRGHLSHFRYIAVAKRGVWCIEELVSVAADERVLWQAEAKDVLPFNPARFCR